ncbi:helix-turn-helix transcriptional regulator [Streptomyces sp. BPTC-684]|uniref:helix-turn-helix domain-containing protein n=1 Tax=Streptomyces sp. BPTC-684 TaxID=3043734 RepID=UPI0024B16AD7|nr:helix-turn-helix transcriptional regulator [Streptomyces sp. BPTC-684]WHM36285.1 helix-turn-helix transcriptional regulator [Streptomyces sp. BPTC-684]
MERTTRATPHQFAAWLHDQLTRRGYDLRPRGGGQTRFADDSRIGRATISRILSGQGATDTRILALLSEALRLPLGEVLVRAGILDESELRAVQDPTPGSRRITPEQAADELGIDDGQSRRLFISMTETLQRTPPPNHGEGRAAER